MHYGWFDTSPRTSKYVRASARSRLDIEFEYLFFSCLLPDKKGKTRHKTPIVKRCLNPSFDYKFTLEDQSLSDLKARVLEITLWDYDLASSDEFLGGVRLGLGTSSNLWDDSNSAESQIWQTILSRHNVWVQVVLPLRVEMKEGSKL